MDNPVNVLSLCTGYEGIGLGLERLGLPLQPVAYVEREGFACANLVAAMEAGKLGSAPVYTDVKTFPYADFLGCVDLLTAGYPCQPFSAAGNRAGKEDPRHLWPWIADGITACRPGWVFLENVEGHISLGLRDVLSDLVGLGYRPTWGIFSAEECGAPHRRKRVFILAHCGGPGLEGHPRDEQGAGRAGTWPDRPTTTGSLSLRWPSRPGEAQQEWEAPRTVANPVRPIEARRESTRRKTESRWAHGELGRPGSLPRQTQPELGRTVDGAGHRVDRLRLLGNGVVPATAALAFATLHEELTKNTK